MCHLSETKLSAKIVTEKSEHVLTNCKITTFLQYPNNYHSTCTSYYIRIMYVYNELEISLLGIKFRR